MRATPPTDTAALVVECRIGDVASRVMEAHARGDTLFVSLAALLALAGRDSAGAAGERSLAAASRLLHADVSFDPAALVVQFADSGTLPVSRRAARSRARSLLHARDVAAQLAAVPAHLARMPSAVAIDYAVQRDGTLTLDATSRAFSGALRASLARDAGSAHVALSWMRVPPGPGGMRVRVGALDELAGGAGILVTNVPVQREDTLSLASLMLPAAPGTEVELFDDGVLVAADSVGASGTMRLRRVHRHGVHGERLVTHDPSGGEHEVRWIESAPDVLLPRGVLRYAMAAGRCVSRSCATGGASVAYAPSDRVTAGMLLGPSASVAGRARPVLQTTLDARIGSSSALSLRADRGAGVAAELRIDRQEGRALAVRSAPAGATAASPLLPAQLAFAHRLTTVVGSWALPRRGALDIGGGFARSAGAIASAASVPTPFGIVQGSASVARDGRAPLCGGWGAGALIRGAWLPRVLTRLRAALFRLRADRRAVACGGSSRSVVVAVPTSATSALELSASWDGVRRARRPALALVLRRRIGSLMTAHAELTAADGSRSTRSGVAGSVILDGLRRSISLALDPTGASATIEGVVYADDNVNGRRDAGEAALAGAVVRSDDASGVSDERGVFVLSGLVPDRVARLSVDSLSVEDAGCVPGAPVSVMLSVRGIVRVDVAVQRDHVGAP